MLEVAKLFAAIFVTTLEGVKEKADVTLGTTAFVSGAKAYDLLSPEQRAVVLMKELEDMQYHEIAEALARVPARTLDGIDTCVDVDTRTRAVVREWLPGPAVAAAR